MTLLTPQDALLVVDVQRDFCPGGALAVPDGDAVIPVLNEWIAAAQAGGAVVAASRDWHPADHLSFQSQGGPWPEHCVRKTPGAEIPPELRLPSDTVLVNKGTRRDREEYSAFDGTDLAEQLRRRDVRRIWVGGLALDYCVKATVLDGVKAGFETHAILSATRAVNIQPDDGARAVGELRAAGVKIEP